MKDAVTLYFKELQDSICAGLEAADGQQTFQEDLWERSGGGGGRTRVLQNGGVFEKAGVNFSEVHGELSSQMEAMMPGAGKTFYATGVSLVLHPRSPMIPTVHANFRYLARGDNAWFGGGADLTPYYVWPEDARHFHQTLKNACTVLDQEAYARFKKDCDDYFFIKHRNEARGVGGIFFDYQQGDMDKLFDFVRTCGNAFLPAYLPIVERRKAEPWGDQERRWQLIRRGRYVEFNLIYDRGTVFGLKTGGRIESILMSLPLEVRWEYDFHPEPGSREADLLEYLKPRDWTVGA